MGRCAAMRLAPHSSAVSGVNIVSLTQIQPILDTLESMVVIAAVIMGGVWSLFIFRILRRRERARLELVEIEKRLHERAVIQLNITAKQEWISDQSGFYISAAVEVLNSGNRDRKSVV